LSEGVCCTVWWPKPAVETLLSKFSEKKKKKLETKGTLLDVHGGGRPEISENTVNDVANRLLASPRMFLRRLSQEIGLSRSTCQRVVKKAGVHAYRFTVVK
jgi:hypothetical protein